jgi:hypothetical protein
MTRFCISAQRDRISLILLAMVAWAAPHGSAIAANHPQIPQLPHMKLERQFAGPLKDTVIQRWRDPADGTICYLYLPVVVEHSTPTPSGFVQYGSNTIGSISCFASVQIGLPIPSK